MNWFVALVLIITAYAGSIGDHVAYELDSAVVSADSIGTVIDRNDADRIVRATVVIARHSCPGSSGKSGPAAISSCISDIGNVVNRNVDLVERKPQARELHAGGFQPGASSPPLFRPPILTV